MIVVYIRDVNKIWSILITSGYGDAFIANVVCIIIMYCGLQYYKSWSPFLFNFGYAMKWNAVSFYIHCSMCIGSCRSCLVNWLVCVNLESETCQCYSDHAICSPILWNIYNAICCRSRCLIINIWYSPQLNYLFSDRLLPSFLHDNTTIMIILFGKQINVYLRLTFTKIFSRIIITCLWLLLTKKYVEYISHPQRGHPIHCKNFTYSLYLVVFIFLETVVIIWLPKIY